MPDIIPTVSLICIFAFATCMIYSALRDLSTMIIPNWVSLVLIATFAALSLATASPLGTIALHLLAGILIFAVGFALFATGVMGGGDVKLLAATSLWFGMNESLVHFVTTVALYGGILTIVVLMARTRFGMPVVSALPMTHNLTDGTKGVPYGIAIGGAGLTCIAGSPLAAAAFAL